MKIDRCAIMLLFVTCCAVQQSNAATFRLYNASDRTVVFGVVGSDRLENRELRPNEWCDLESIDDLNERVLTVRSRPRGDSSNIESIIYDSCIVRVHSAPSKLIVAFCHLNDDRKVVLDMFVIGAGSILPLSPESKTSKPLERLQRDFHVAAEKAQHSEKSDIRLPQP